MNRVRKINDKYQVLLTPHHRFHAGIELMLGNWSDSHFDKFYVESYDLWEDAIARAYQLPDINWDQLVLFHKDIYANLFDVIQYELSANVFNGVAVQPKLLTAHEAKNLMFNRISIYGERFRLIYHMNDIISFIITDMYFANLREIAEVLSVNQALRIMFKKIDKDGTIRLVGKTDLGTSFEIILTTNLISYWHRWLSKNMHMSKEYKMKKLNEITTQQNMLDQKYVKK